MTNTRITDPEILESRFMQAFLLKNFDLDIPSFCAVFVYAMIRVVKEDGAVEKVFNDIYNFVDLFNCLFWPKDEFLSHMVSKTFKQMIWLIFLGLEGGNPALCGVNTLHRVKDNSRVNMGSKNSSEVEAGVSFFNKFMHLIFRIFLS